LALAAENKAIGGAMAEAITGRVPRVSIPSAAELEAHAAMVAQLKAPLWVEAEPA
jgi:UDP:flavonoid glycosyltransferase YjiC (YdhE family)